MEGYAEASNQEYHSKWSEFFQGVKQRPAEFYKRCEKLLEGQDIYEPDDLVDVDLDFFKSQLEASVTAGQRTFLEQAVEMARAQKAEKHAKDETLKETKE